MRILLVGDVREVTTRFLWNAAGWSVTQADSAEAGFDLPSSYQAVVTDLDMPVMGGLELIRRLRGEHLAQEISIPAVSGGTDPEAKRRGFLAGASTFRDKLFPLSRLGGLIESFARSSAICPR
jgi:DNA-binding response OmpR family regulator